MSIGEIFYNLIKAFLPQYNLPPWSLLPVGSSAEDATCGLGTTQSYWIKQAGIFADWELRAAFASGEVQTKLAQKRAAISVKFGKCACCSVSPNASLFPTCVGSGDGNVP